MTPATVPMISPDGQSGDIPQERAQDAIAAGFKPAMVMTSPDGQLGYIPHERAADALKAGFKAGQPAVQGMGGQGFDEQHPIAAKVMSGMDAFGRGVEKGAYAIPDAIELVRDSISHPENHRTVHDAKGIKGKAQAILNLNNPLPPDQGQGMTDRVIEGAGTAIGAGITAPVLESGQLRAPNVKSAAVAARDAWQARRPLSEAFQEKFGNNPQGKVMESAAQLPAAARSGVEDIFRAAAPTGMNKGFRENLNVAAPDLADIARKVDISETKGGIISPDMRVRATVNAIRDHLDEMYKQERAPQIERNAELPVKVGANPNSQRGLQYLEATAGEIEDSQIAKKALEEQTLTVAESDRLAQLANKTLRSYEKMTPEGKMQLQATNPKIGGIKALDAELGFNLNSVLISKGESGLRAYERRFAALSAVRDQLESRTNAVELHQPGAVKGIVEPVGKMVGAVIGNPKAGIASASQAAVADVNIGRTLQNGLSKLKASGLTAKRSTAGIQSPVRPQ